MKEQKQTTKKSKVTIFSKSPFRLENENVIRFKDKKQMDNFFKTSKLLTKISENDTYAQIKNTGEILVSGNVEKFENATYIMFTNKGRTYYCFVFGSQFINSNTTRLFYEVDVFNTYQLEILKNNNRFNLLQGHSKRYKGSDPIIENFTQDFNVGSLYTRSYTVLDTFVDWLVIVAKPTIKLNKDDKDGKSYGSIVGDYKAFRYFIVPVNISSGQIRPFSFKGQKTESRPIRTYIKQITDTFKDDKNTVNQIVNMYTTKSVGITYEMDKATVVIKDVDGINIKSVGKGTTTGGGNEGGGNEGGNTKGDYKGKDLVNSGKPISASNVNKMINGFRKVGVKVDYNFVLTQMYLESHWGDPNVSTVAVKDNNWSGISMPFTIPDKYGVKVTNGTARPSVEGGYYAHFDTLDDYFIAYAYVLSLENGLYKVDGTKTIESYTKGLFRVGGASSDYAAAGYEHYLNLMFPTYNAILSQNPEQTKELKELSPVY